MLAVDLLPESPRGSRWVLIVCDTVAKYVELFAIPVANAEACAKILIEVFPRYGAPMKIIYNSGVQFVNDDNA